MTTHSSCPRRRFGKGVWQNSSSSSVFDINEKEKVIASKTKLSYREGGRALGYVLHEFRAPSSLLKELELSEQHEIAVCKLIKKKTKKKAKPSSSTLNSQEELGEEFTMELNSASRNSIDHTLPFSFGSAVPMPLHGRSSTSTSTSTHAGHLRFLGSSSTLSSSQEELGEEFTMELNSASRNSIDHTLPFSFGSAVPMSLHGRSITSTSTSTSTHAGHLPFLGSSSTLSSSQEKQHEEDTGRRNCIRNSAHAYFGRKFTTLRSSLPTTAVTLQNSREGNSAHAFFSRKFTTLRSSLPTTTAVPSVPSQQGGD